MENLKPILKTFALIMLLAFASCKKDGKDTVKPDEINTVVTSNDLLAYNIVALISNSGLRVIYFNKDGNDIKATFDAVSLRRILPVSVVNNKGVMDLNGNGSVIYTFVFGRDKTGKISMLSQEYKNQADASATMGTRFFKNDDLPDFAGLKFVGNTSSGKYLKFSGDHNFAVSDNADYAGSAFAGYYDLCKGAWKGKYNGVDYMGLTIKSSDAGKPAQMWLQKSDDVQFHVYDQKKD